MSDDLMLFSDAIDMERDATLSPCGRYRYSLTRRWGPGESVTFIMLNPSTADASVDDPTIRRCIAFAARWDYCALQVVNLYAWRATDPADMMRAADPVGPDNDSHIEAALLRASDYAAPVVAAWGAHGASARVAQVRRLRRADRLSCLGVTKSGQPRHPLYMRADSVLRPWPLGGAA